MKNHIVDLVKGGLIGVSNIIPGVSGGTIALVLRIYERIITAINHISIRTVLSFLKIFTFRKNSLKEFIDEFDRIDGRFLMRLSIGALAAVFLLAKTVSTLLENYHDPTFGFFFGLVLLSAVTPYSLIKKKTVPVLAAILIAAGGIITIAELFSDEKELKARTVYPEVIQISEPAPPSAESAESAGAGGYIIIFFSGAAAISAMALPGISGSLILILTGTYFEILEAVASLNLFIVLIFAIGCIFGLLLFSRIIAWLLNRFYDQTMGALLGLVIGSLWILWPFKETIKAGEEIIYLSNRFPSSFGLNEILTFAGFAAGAIFILIILTLDRQFNTSK